MSFFRYLSDISSETRTLLLAYGVLGGLYLILVPLALYWWMNRRWYIMGKIERLFVYGLVFLFFPGLILLSPFLNMRLKGQGET
uniref:NAD(P)H-quinone oxidoreductase subunit L, organellar chromatophore n=1 Tax=Paulinella chromatophora TaxID=39717 RepID=NDHL_PAUCH|nr:NADH dehydrogenase subunit; NdhL [Paulinella chromatophora]B1X3F0.1 RecName: Full=NAD(P)H-quinone oxidoreductase subunit L, organellar chromatophore; AltName: Full=NAD(P)H dehydrogenase I subunit L; AltName: Full=NDH-1 subunit L; AltName: Full=NDH-L [Paulinella chromatophora]ACB42469.1 NADH dehydrogenase subunit; NdhL [Paulinella chromatophora]